MKKMIPINANRGGQVATTLLSGYWKFGGETFAKGYNGAMCIGEYEDLEERNEEDHS